MEKSPPLSGTVKISGAKNAVLPILAASLLTDEECKISSVPDLSDVENMIELLGLIGADSEFDRVNENLKVQTKKVKETKVDYDLAGKFRASFLVMGPLLARCKKVKLPLPGGCAIGTRPVDLHLKGFALMGAKITTSHGYVDVKAKELSGCRIYLDFPSVGATENIMMAAVLAKGTTFIENAAAEPEIIDLANFLKEMGAKIYGAGTDKIKIIGVNELKGVEYKVIPDRIEAGTFMAAAAITGGDIVIENVVVEHLTPVIAKLQETNVICEKCRNGLHVCRKSLLKPFSIKTMPYPGFPTDMQAPFMSLMVLAKGTSMLTETIFENRFMQVGELKRMGADITIESRMAVIEGVPRLTGTQVKATDLRAGAALVIAALAAEGETEISDIYHIDRGYCRLEEKLKALGAQIKRTES